MSIIQDIREKYAKLTVVVIAVALIGFILTDYFSGKGRAGNGRGSNSLGSVNGRNINGDEFAKKVDQLETNYKDQGYPAAMATSQALNTAWDQEVNNILLTSELDKLGMKIGKKELGDILYSPTSNLAQDLRQQLTDSTGYDPIRAKQRIDELLKSKDASLKVQQDNLNNYVEQLKQQRLSEKYVTLLTNSTNYPRWFLEKQNADNSQIGKISMVRESYASIVDSTVKIDDKEIAEYISKHKDEFKQEESRNIVYVTFNAAPTSGDSAVVKNELLASKAEFDTTANLATFLMGQGVTYTDAFRPGKSIENPVKDSIFKLPAGVIYGPYINGNSFALAKVIAKKQVFDTVKVRHILISTAQRDPQTGQMNPVRDSVSAYNLADSIRKAIARGANFDSLCVKFSEDDGSKAKGGEYDIIYGQMVPEFNDFAFSKPVGSKDIVKTDFGYHYMEIISQKGSDVAYKLAEIKKEIIASPETVNTALDEANQFAADSRDAKGFDEVFEKTQKPKGRVKGIAVSIRPVDAQVQGLGFSRQLVRNIYKGELGEVLKPENVNDNYVVAAITAVAKEGTMSAAAARPNVEPLLRNKKKAAILKQKIGKVTTLEAAATALGGKPVEVVDSIRMNSTSTLGYEPRISGATFNPGNKGKVVTEPLEGVYGVYVIRVENVSATPTTNGDIAEQRKVLYQQTKQYINNPQAPAYPINALKKAATIKDKRADRF
ncbi:MAG TPA: peptidylprolyl isomerase [Chitinophagaceae bacterium]|jgi:peptidyl-prolyl cis-trans isomerase D|nr:peptidylprolyl isomerase [Chitinophagaceae bacterium]